jgi:primosomal replication protein N
MIDPSLNINSFRLTARLSSKEAIRYTPAGQAVLKCELQHSGTALEANRVRKVEMSLMAIGVGQVVEVLDQLEIGQLIDATGFMAQMGFNRKVLVFHITNINT